MQLATALSDILSSLVQGHRRKRSHAVKQPRRAGQRMRADDAPEAGSSQVLTCITLKALRLFFGHSKASFTISAGAALLASLKLNPNCFKNA